MIIEIPKQKIATNNFFPAFLVTGIYADTNIIIRAPTAGAARNIPKPFEPTFKMSWANIGSKAIAPPNNTATISKVIATSINFVLNTKF